MHLQARQVAASIDADLVYHPSGSVVQVLDLYSGAQVKLLRGHLDTINACVFNPRLQELYTGADDASILVWAQEPLPISGDCDSTVAKEDADCWSD